MDNRTLIKGLASVSLTILHYQLNNLIQTKSFLTKKTILSNAKLNQTLKNSNKCFVIYLLKKVMVNYYFLGLVYFTANLV